MATVHSTGSDYSTLPNDSNVVRPIIDVTQLGAEDAVCQLRAIMCGAMLALDDSEAHQDPIAAMAITQLCMVQQGLDQLLEVVGGPQRRKSTSQAVRS